jgi:flagellin
MAQLTKLDFGINTTMSRLSSGLRLNSAADGPSDISIANAMDAHVRGTRTAIANAQDALSMMAFADTSLNESMNILQRMNELSVKAANQAILTTGDISAINSELTKLKDELSRRSSSVSFNTKLLFSGAFSGGQIIQIGANNVAANRLTLMIFGMTNSGLYMVSGVKGTNFYNGGSLMISNVIVGAAMVQSALGMAQAAINYIQTAIKFVSDVQAAIGVQEEKLQFIINDLSAEDINVSAAKSRITDADMASEISNFTRLQVLSQAATAMLAQANVQPQAIVKLLGA